LFFIVLTPYLVHLSCVNKPILTSRPL